MLAAPLLAALLAVLAAGPSEDPPSDDDDAPRAAPAKRAPRGKAKASKPARSEWESLDLDEARRVAQETGAPVAVREHAIRAIAFRGTSEADVPLLARLLIEDNEVSVRFLAARALEHRKVRGPELAQALQQDPDARVRRAAARALGRMGPDGTRQETTLISSLEDPDSAVAEEAAIALKSVGSRASLGMLTSAAKRHPNAAVARAARTALNHVQRRAQEREGARRRTEDGARVKADPRAANPLLFKVLGYGGTVYSTVAGGVLGVAMGAMLPVALLGTRWGPWLWPVGAAGGAVVGAGLGFGYGAARLFRFPLTDAILISAHAASGTLAGVGLGLAMGNRSALHYTAALGVLGGTGATVLSAVTNPFIKTRPSGLVGTLSGGMLGAAVGLLGAGAFGVDVFQKPQLALGFALMGQGLGVVAGTLLTAGIPVTAQDIVLVDVGAMTGAAFMAGSSVLVIGVLNTFAQGTGLPGSALTSGQANGMVLAGMVAGAGGGALAAAFMPNVLENRLQSGFQWEDIPVRLIPSLPTPVVQPSTGKVNGALLPVLNGTWW